MTAAGQHLAQAELTTALEAEYAALDTLLSSLGPGEWNAPTPCPGWDMRAVVAHILGTELAQAGEPPPPELPPDRSTSHLRNAVGLANERWIAAFENTPPEELLRRFRDVTSARLAALHTLPADEWDAPVSTPTGPGTYGRLVRIRVFDCWMHEQDIRDAVNRPGHDAGPEVGLVLDEISAALGYVVAKKAGAPSGSAVTFDLTGPAARRIHVLVEARASVVEHLTQAATATLRMPVTVFTRLCGGRIDLTAADVEFSGDEALGRQVAANLAYTI